MKRYLKVCLIILLEINCSILFSQGIQGEVEYSYRVEDEFINSNSIKKLKNSSLQNNLSFFNKSLKDNMDYIKFNLRFNNKESIYSMKEALETDNNKSLKYAVILARGDEIIYTNTKNKFKKTELLGTTFIIKEKVGDTKWELTSETKKLGKYVCYKAITTKKIKQKEVVIEAWYTPEISVNIGPRGYGGLPGLILELKENNLIYYATKIILNPRKKISIQRPKAGKVVSKSQLDSIVSAAAKNFGKGVKKGLK